MIKMIALDLDGTLAIENHGVLPATRNALHELHSDGVEVVIATGRRYRTTRFVMENLGLETFAICNGGALVKTPKQETLHRDFMDVSPITPFTRELGLNLFAQRDAYDHGGSDFVIDSGVTWTDTIEQHYENNKQWSSAADLNIESSEYLVCGVFGDEQALNQLAENIAEQFSGEYNTIVVPHLQTNYCYCEISQNHVDKWHGISQLSNHLKITADEICAVGDQLNDMAMVKAAGHGFSMSNGHEELRAAANHVCGHNQEDGIVDVANYITEFNKELNTEQNKEFNGIG